MNSLSESTQPLEDFYNERTGRSQFLAVLSPTCPGCIQGANAVRNGVLDAFQGKLDVGIVWISMLETDTDEAIEQATAEFEGHDVEQFADPDRSIGRLIARSLGAGEPHDIAWDVYLFYDADARWTSGPPEPTNWVHQLAPSPWTPSERYRCSCDGDLTESLHRVATQIVP